MKNLKIKLKQVIFFGFMNWLIPFIISLIIYPLKDSNIAFFESIMTIVLTASVSFFCLLMIRTSQKIKRVEGFVIGVSWLLLSVFFDFFIFIRGPIQMNALDYVYDIGLTYLIIPTIVIFGYSSCFYFRQKKNNSDESES